MKLAEAVRFAETRLRTGPHAERARLDAEVLLLHTIGKDRAWLLTHGDEEFGGCTATRYAALLDRRVAGEPIQYITGECEFYGLPFRVTPAVLIPRPETEHVVEKAVARAARWERARILDVGTGSGAIAVALAHALPDAVVWAVDVSPEALEIARGNAERNGVLDRVRLVQSDLLAAVSEERFELVVSNPPYVPELDRAGLAIEVREHEPELALFAGEDGLDVYRRLIPAAARALAASGSLVLEIGYDQAEAVLALLTASGFSNVEFAADLQGIARVAVAQLR